MQCYKTITFPCCQEFTQKRSRFIANIKPVSSEIEARKVIADFKIEYWDATHNVYAYIIKNNNIQRYSDDNEPKGTAGVPVLQVLKENHLTNVVVVVTRYFGGILLGSAGLVKAYSHVAALVVKASDIVSMRPCMILDLVCDYKFFESITNLISNNFGGVLNTVFTDRVKITLFVFTDFYNDLVKALENITSSKINLRFIKNDFFPYKEKSRNL